jgi:hypothetical protein
VIVTAMSGIVFCPVLRTAITMRDRCASRWKVGNLATATDTGKMPVGSDAFCSVPPPQADSARLAAIPAMTPQLLVLRPLTARLNIPRVVAREWRFWPLDRDLQSDGSKLVFANAFP